MASIATTQIEFVKSAPEKAKHTKTEHTFFTEIKKSTPPLLYADLLFNLCGSLIIAQFFYFVNKKPEKTFFVLGKNTIRFYILRKKAGEN